MCECECSPWTSDYIHKHVKTYNMKHPTALKQPNMQQHAMDTNVQQCPPTSRNAPQRPPMPPNVQQCPPTSKWCLLLHCSGVLTQVLKIPARQKEKGRWTCERRNKRPVRQQPQNMLYYFHPSHRRDVLHHTSSVCSAHPNHYGESGVEWAMLDFSFCRDRIGLTLNQRGVQVERKEKDRPTQDYQWLRCPGGFASRLNIFMSGPSPVERHTLYSESCDFHHPNHMCYNNNRRKPPLWLKRRQKNKGPASTWRGSTIRKDISTEF